MKQGNVNEADKDGDTIIDRDHFEFVMEDDLM